MGIIMKDILKHNMDLYNKMIQDVNSYSKYYTKMLGKIVDTYNPPNKSIKDKTGTFPANGHEIYNYVARYNMSNLQIQAIMKLDGKLDYDILKRAVRLSIVAEPVLGCRFVEDDPPYWRPLENINMIEFCSIEETEDVDLAIQKFMLTPLDIDNGPMVKVKLMRSDKYDVLGLKVNHACCDGAGAEEYIHLLADIYTKIDQENRNYIPQARIGGRKDQDRLFQELGITNPDAIFIPGSDILAPMWPFPWEQSGSNIACMSVRRLSSGYFESISKYAKSRGATINDVILTAFYRAMQAMGQPIYGLPMEIPVTVNLRRYLPDHKTQAIRNFSGSVTTRLAMSIDEPFSKTLRRVTNMMEEVKNGYPGLQSAIGLERLEKISFKDTLAYYLAAIDAKKTQSSCPLYFGDKCVPTLSNLGYLSKSLIKFGNKTVIDAFVLPPVVRAPGILIMANTYNSVLTLAMGYYKSTVSKENVEKLLGKIRDELIEGCRKQ